ncbi:MAG: hypothetical protein QNJ53_21620, partial [Pleurocapsa sp. MO_192.B19]|nr:hypothetical protein [Pleurocapsa sp. MO_192.B19]
IGRSPPPEAIGSATALRAIASSAHPPSVILPLSIVIRQRLLRSSLGLKPLFDGAFREAVKSQLLTL